MHPATTAGAAGPPIQNPAATSTDYNPPSIICFQYSEFLSQSEQSLNHVSKRRTNST